MLHTPIDLFSLESHFILRFSINSSSHLALVKTVDPALQSSLLNLPGNQLFGTDVEPVRSMPVSFVASHALGSVPNLASHALGSTRTIVTALYQNKGCMLLLAVRGQHGKCRNQAQKTYKRKGKSIEPVSVKGGKVIIQYCTEIYTQL